jgi:hypothetical protein
MPDTPRQCLGQAGGVPHLLDSADAATQRLARAAVRAHATTERRRRFAPLLHLGVPGAATLSVAAHPATTDHALRCDLVAAMLARHDEEHLLWLTRPGELELHDTDAAWLSPALAAYAEAGRDLTFVVVTRHGWWDPRSDVRRVWQRIRR